MARNPESTSVEELAITADSRPFMFASPPPAGYEEREFAVGGSATLFEVDDLAALSVKPREERSYRTRFMVRYPSDPARFDGTVVIEWLNVSGMFDVDAVWLAMSPAITAEGCAYVGVTAQAAGASHLQTWNAERYGDLGIDDDGLSYGIFSAVARLVRERSTDLLGGLEAQRLIGTGSSQSAFRLTTSIDFFHPRDRAFDGYLLRGRGLGGAPMTGTGIATGPRPLPIRLDLDVPVMALQNEGDLLALRYVFEQQQEGPLIRVWELPGAAHGSLEGSARLQSRFAANGIGRPTVLAGLPAQSPTSPSVMRIDPVNAMAFHHMVRWVASGEAPPPAPPIERIPDIGPMPTDDGLGGLDPALIARDADGNALGGIRVPDTDAPVGQLVGSTAGGLLSGEFVPFTRETLARRYPTKEHYVEAVRESARRAEAAGWISSGAAQAYVEEADASDVPNALPSYALGLAGASPPRS
jgi:hypothetical protein